MAFFNEDMPVIILDYETRSRVNLPECGLYVYATDPSTDIICLFMYDTDDDTSCGILMPQCMPMVWRMKLKDATLVGAMNAAFDREIHNLIGVPDYSFPEIEDDKWYCIAAQCRVNALPSNLDDATRAAKVNNKKNPRGKQLIKLLSIPQEDGTFNEHLPLRKEMLDYCKDDVLATVDLWRATRSMTQDEHNDWLINERMNIRGVMIDRDLASAATYYAAAEQSEIGGKLQALTDNAITKPTQYQRIKEYILDSMEDDENDRKLYKLMTTNKKEQKKISLDRDIRESIITAIDSGNLYLFEDIEDLIRLLHDASASSVAKFGKMLTMADPEDDRVRGAFIHAGAAQTHRFSSKGLQLHNMKRDCYDADEAIVLKATMMRNEPVPDVMQSLSKLLRPALIPANGCKYVVGDWSAIEARALPWLSGDPKAERKLDMFRNGVDVYVEAAKDLGLGERQVGKVAELALGYGGAVGAFASMAKNYGVIKPDYEVKKIVKAWRNANPWAETFWHALETAAKKAVRAKGTKSFRAGKVVYTFAPNLLGGTLICLLPDGTGIQYPFCSIEHSDRGDNLVCLKAGIKPKVGDTSKHHWGVVRLWGGLLSENVTQAFCAALLRDKLRDCDWLDLPVVAHVHDEIIVETHEAYAERDKKQLKEVMEQVPEYAQGLPLKAEPVILDRYGNH